MQPFASSYRPAVAVIKQIQEITLTEFQKEVIFSQSYLGASNQLAMEIDHESVVEQERFTQEWMKCLKAETLFESLFVNIQHGASEIWQAVD